MNDYEVFFFVRIKMKEQDYVIDMETLERLIHIIENDKFYRMPSGLTREERRAYIKEKSKEIQKNEIQS